MTWFIGYGQVALQTLIDEKVTFRSFFEGATIHPDEHLIKGIVCGFVLKKLRMNLNSTNNVGKWKS